MARWFGQSRRTDQSKDCLASSAASLPPSLRGLFGRQATPPQQPTGATSTPQNIANTNVPTSWGATGTTAATRRSDLQTEANDYKTAYTGTYDTAYTKVFSDMGTTATTTTWNSFDWRYQNSTLAWGNYQEDLATTFLASMATPRDGTGCDLSAVVTKGIDAVNKAVFRHASGFAGGNKKHCYRHPSSAQLGTPPRPAFAFFDDTAHSARVRCRLRSPFLWR